LDCAGAQIDDELVGRFAGGLKDDRLGVLRDDLAGPARDIAGEALHEAVPEVEIVGAVFFAFDGPRGAHAFDDERGRGGVSQRRRSRRDDDGEGETYGKPGAHVGSSPSAAPAATRMGRYIS